jgi:hypothetical protein
MSSPTTIRELLVRIGVQADDKALVRFDHALTAAKSSMSAAAGFAAKLAGGFAAVTGALAMNTSAVAGEIEQTKLLADALGVTTEQYQRLVYVGSTVGANAEQVRQSLAKVTQVSAQVRDGNEQAAEGFATLGLSMREVRDLDPAALLARVADGVRATEDPFKRTTALVRIFGDDLASKLTPMLQQGAAGLAAIGAQADAAGAVFGGDAVDSALAYQDAMNQLRATLSGLRTAIGVAFLPAMTRATERLRVFLQTSNIRSGLERAVRGVGLAVDGMVAAFVGADKVVSRVLGGWDVLLGGVAASIAIVTAGRGLYLLYGLGASITGVVSALGGLLGIAGAPLWAGFAVIVAATAATLASLAVAIAPGVLVLQDLYTWVTGGESAFGMLLDRFPDIQRFFGALVRLGGAAWEAMKNLGGAALVVAQSLARVLMALPGFRLMGQALERVTNAVQGWAEAWASGRVEGFEATLNAAANGAEKLAGWVESLATGTESWALALQRIADEYLPGIEEVLERITPSFETLGRVYNFAASPGAALAGEGLRAAGPGGRAALAAVASPGATLGGMVAGRAAQAVSAGASRVSNATVNVTSPINVTSSDPFEAARQVQLRIEEAARNASATLLGGDR